jgi:hypothetical protein
MLPVFAAKVSYTSKVVLSNEHVAFKWVTPEDAKNMLAWDDQRKSIDVIVDYFLNRNSFLNFMEINIPN